MDRSRERGREGEKETDGYRDREHVYKGFAPAKGGVCLPAFLSLALSVTHHPKHVDGLPYVSMLLLLLLCGLRLTSRECVRIGHWRHLLNSFRHIRLGVVHHLCRGGITTSEKHPEPWILGRVLNTTIGSI